jgi:glycosyltransferase involved in cell wall biosynthesis
MKLLWLAHEGGISGANICLLEYMRILQDKGYAQHLIVPSAGDLAKETEALGIPATCIPFYSWTSAPGEKPPGPQTRFRRGWRNRIARQAIQKLIESFGADFVLTNSITIPIGAYAARQTGKRHIWFVHEFGEEDHGFIIAGGFSRGARIMDRLSEKVVFNSSATERKFGPFIQPSKRYRVSYPLEMPPLEPASIGIGLPSPAQKLKLIMLGQIAPSKDQLEAIKALQICREKGLSFELNIVGKPDQPDYLRLLEKTIREAGMETRVNFPGPSRTPALRLSENHVLLMCSRMEAFGRVTVEALKMGLPVIAAGTGGSLELIEDGVNGYLYQKGDPTDLAVKILRLQKDYEMFDKMKIASSARTRFNSSNTALQLEKVLC